MKKNNKGFMLVEVIIVSTVIVTALVGLYYSFNQVYVKYNDRGKYYNIDAMYACNEFTRYALQDINFNQFVNQIIEGNDGYSFIIEDSNCTEDSNILGVSDICLALNNFYEIKNMIFLEYDENILLKIKNLVSGGKAKLNVGFQEYIDYVLGYYDIKNSNLNLVNNSTNYSYIILIELDDLNGDSYYSSLRIR